MLPALHQSTGTAVFEPALPAEERSGMAKKAEETPPREELFYQRAKVGPMVKLPLWRNKLVWFIVLLMIVPVGCILYPLLRKKRENSNRDLRRKEFGRIKAELISNIHHAEEVERILRSDVVPFIMPGAAPEEVAEKMTDPELKSLFEECGKSGFMPGSSSAGISLAPGLLKKLLKLLKASLVILFAVIPLYGDDFNADFDSGNYDKAIETYRKYVNGNEVSVNMLYNLGGAYFRKGDLPMARYCFLLAHRIAPRDHEIAENLALVNRKLMQEEENKGFISAVVGFFRPDEYMLGAAFAVALLCIALNFRKKIGKIALLWIATAAVLIFTFSVTLLAVQYTWLYSPRNGILIGREIPLKTLPAEGAGHVSSTLTGGGNARFVEERGKWLRIRANGKEGWIDSSQFKKLNLF